MGKLKKLLVPDAHFISVCDISPDYLRERGIRFLLADLDNTLVPYDPQELTDELVLWKQSLDEAGIGLMIVSNNRTWRVERFAGLLGVDWIMRAKKPRGPGIDEAVQRLGATAENTATVGDQIRTDIIGGHIRGMRALYVEPIKNDNLLRKVRYMLAKPIVKQCKER